MSPCKVQTYRCEQTTRKAMDSFVENAGPGTSVESDSQQSTQLVKSPLKAEDATTSLEGVGFDQPREVRLDL